MEYPAPIHTSHLFDILDQKLIKLLRSLNDDDWNKPTIAKLWTVKDIAAHLLDGNIWTIAARDNYRPSATTNITNYNELVAYVNNLNALWVNAMKRTSPGLLTELLAYTGKQYCEYMLAAEPFAVANFSVAWAGETQSYNWFHIAREYTEKWHHQQQIRMAVGLEDELYTAELYFPYLETSMRALPYHYRTVRAQNGDNIKFTIKGFGEWFLSFADDTWHLVPKTQTPVVSNVEIEFAAAWRNFTKSLTKDQAKQKITITGDRVLGEHILDMVAVMA